MPASSTACLGVGRRLDYPPTEGVLVKKSKSLFGRLVADEQGGEVLEYVLIAGLIVVATVVVIGAVGTKVVGRWNTVDSGL